MERTNASEVTESRFMVAMLSKALDKDAIDSVTKRAMELYTLCCKRRGGGSARQLTRFDKGVKRGVAKKAGTESAWLKRRRTQVAYATANDTVATPPRRNAETLPEWVSSHEKERRTQHDRLVVRAVDAWALAFRVARAWSRQTSIFCVCAAALTIWGVTSHGSKTPLR